MRKSVILVTLMVSGCGGWSKPGGNATEFAQDKYQCEMQVAQAYPVMMTTSTYGNGYQAPTRTNCQTYNGVTNCTSTPGAYTPPAQQTTDANAIARAGAMNSCLRARGYTFSFR